MTTDEDSPKKTEFFSTNSMVEVSRHNNGGCWCVAKILSSYYSSFTRKEKFLVQYQSLASEFDTNVLLTECVDSSLIRPRPPPPAADQSYEPLDIVDAFHRGGWRKGVVSKVGVLEVNSKSIRYIVVFGNPPEKSYFSSAELRFHFDWTDAKWVRPPKLKELLNRPQCEKQAVLAKNSSKNLLEQSNPLVAAPTSEEQMKPAPETDETLPNISENFSKEKWVNPSSPEQSCGTSMLMKSTEQAAESAIAEFSTCDSGGNLPLAGSNNHDIESDTGAYEQEAGQEKGIAETSMKAEKELNAQVTGQNVAAAVGEDKRNEEHLEATNIGNVENFINQSSHMNVQVEQSNPLVATSTTEKVMKSAPETGETFPNYSDRFSKEKCVNRSSPEQSCASLRLMKSKEQATECATAQFTACDSGGNLPVAGSNNLNKGSHIGTNRQKAGPEKGMAETSMKRETELNAQVTGRHVADAVGENKTNEDRLEAINGGNVENLINQSCAVNVQAESELVQNLPLAGSNNPDKRSNTGTNQLEAGPEKGRVETSMKRERELNGQVTVQQVTAAEDEANEDHLEAINEGSVENQSSSVNVQEESEQVKNQEMPFTRSSFLWQFIDSLQVFEFLPQKPHFRPLLKCNEATREGSAIGHMWNFANLVDMASKLQIEDPKSLFKRYLEALADLELLGFDVEVVVNRINKLLSIKSRQEQLKKQSKDIHRKIAQSDAEKAKKEEEIKALDKTISELKAERAMKSSEKAMKDSESNMLHMDAKRIIEHITNAKLDFESKAVAPW